MGLGTVNIRKRVFTLCGGLEKFILFDKYLGFSSGGYFVNIEHHVVSSAYTLNRTDIKVY
jgi:hypothetical protein